MSTVSRVVDSSERNGVAFVLLRSHLFILLLVFVATVPLINPLVHGDGVGYYAYLRAPVIQHNLRFEEDWRRANAGFIETKLSPDNQLTADQYSSTGYIGNLFTPGPAILWSPFFLLAHAAVLTANLLGAHIPADGFSLPYRVMVAFGTSFYGFCGLLLSYLFARKYVESSYALLATLGIWGASSLPVYMYFNPFWSHAHSAFMVALFLWYWDRTQSNRTLGQWILLGVISGLLVDVYFVNGVFLLIPLIESILDFAKDLRSKDGAAFLRRFGVNLAFLMTFVAFLFAHPDHTQNYFWRNASLRFILRIEMELACPFLAFSSFFFRSRDAELDSSIGVRDPRTIASVHEGQAS